MLGPIKSYLAILTCVFPLVSFAEFVVEDADETGVVNPTDFSWRHYQQELQRLPRDRIGFLCYNAYILDKTGSFTEDALTFHKACADKGIVLSMIFLSSHYENGNRVDIDYAESARWLKRASESRDEAGYSELAAFHYGHALAKGRGVEKDLMAARVYLQRAVDANIQNASESLKVLDQ